MEAGVPGTALGGSGDFLLIQNHIVQNGTVETGGVFRSIPCCKLDGKAHSLHCPSHSLMQCCITRGRPSLYQRMG